MPLLGGGRTDITVPVTGRKTSTYLFLDAGKTSAIWLGNRRNSAIKYMPNLHME